MTHRHHGDRASSPSWILSVATRARCPRCGKGRLFDGFLALAKRCEACDLDYSFADPADGPAFFVMMGMGIPSTALGVWLELAHEPPIWVHGLVTVPVVLALCILPLRFMKGALVASQYVHEAEEARFRAPIAETPR
jgi:uncharacterized protein (DUF983 family)